MTNKKFSSKKYNDYPVIIDNERNVELTLDTVVEVLNDYEFMRKFDIKEHNDLHKQIEYILSQRNKAELQRDKLIVLIVVMAWIIIIETLLLLGG